MDARMRPPHLPTHRRVVRARLAALAVPVLAASVLTAALAAPGARADAAAPPAPPALGAPSLEGGDGGDGAQTVATLTGGRLLARSDGTVTVERGGPALSYVAPNGDRYVVPSAAAPYAGRSLDWSLFDVSALLRDQITGTAQIPVALSLTRPGAAPPPGVTLVSSAGVTARGYLTPSSAATFAGFLRDQIAADLAAGRPAGTTPLPGVARITLAADVPGPNVSPQFAYRIAQFDTAGLDGPANAIIKLWNMDSFQRVSITFASFDGIARLALPAGNYFAVAQFTDFDARGNTSAVRYVTAGFTLSDSGPLTTVDLAESSASTRSTVSTPLPAQQVNQILTWGLQSTTGDWDGVTAVTFGAAGTAEQGEAGADVYVAPTQSGPPAGRLRYCVQWDGVAPPTGGSYPYPDESSYPYRYDVAFGWDDMIPPSPYVVRSDQLATVHDHVYVDPAESPANFQFAKAPIDPVLPAGFAAFQLADLWTREAPGDFTDYVGTADGGDWILNGSIGPNLPANQDSVDPRIFAAGQVYSTDWGRGPLTPQWGQHQPRPAELYENCEACVAESANSDYLVALYPANSQDTQQDATGWRYLDETGACYVDGTQVASYPACIDYHDFSTDGAAPSRPKTYRLVLDTAVRPDLPVYSQSTPTHTELTFRYAYKTQPPADMTLPTGYQCEQQPAPGGCEILPVLTLSYELAEDEYNTSDAPVQRMKLNVAHETFDGIGSHAAITSASVQVSFDGGTTWRPAVLGGHDGHYVATWHNPASARGSSPALKVTATDAIGGSITQVIDNAYTISAAR